MNYICQSLFHVDKIYIFPYMSDLAIIEEREKERKIVNAEMSANSEKSKQKNLNIVNFYLML